MTDALIRRNPVEALETEILELEKQRTAPPSQEGTPPSPPERDENLTPEEATWRKRHGDLRRFSAEKERKLQQEIDDLKAELAKPKEGVPTTEEQIKEWATRNPQATAIIQALATEQVSRRSVEIENQLSEVKRDKQEQAIRKVHSDYDEIVVDDAFHDWAETQRPAIQKMIYESSDPEDVISVLNLYKTVKGKVANIETKESAKAIRTAKGDAPGSGKEPLFSESMINKNSIQWFEKNQAAIEEAIRTGRFEYDLSGAAR